jgi:hypothetical protein
MINISVAQRTEIFMRLSQNTWQRIGKKRERELSLSFAQT